MKTWKKIGVAVGVLWIGVFVVCVGYKLTHSPEYTGEKYKTPGYFEAKRRCEARMQVVPATDLETCIPQVQKLIEKETK